MGAEHAELDRLRQRAYGPDADIHDDPSALHRLIELEDLQIVLRRPSPHFDDPADRTPPAPAASSGRWHTALVVTVAAVAVALGATAWAAGRIALPEARTPAGEDQVSYARYLDGLRDDVLALPGAGVIAEHLVRDRLTPYGVLYGRTVGAGPTDDDRLCMVIADLPAASVMCIPADSTDSTTYANALRTYPVSIALPAWYSDADSDLFTGLGEQISFTLMPDGTVIAVPADQVGGPTPTATPPPGWQ